MNNYDFTTLNDKEFENLSRDLLNAKYKIGLQSFKTGKDKGIDLRFSTPKNNNSIIVQVKHYAGSTFSQLKHTLIHKELEKINKLKPNRYIVVTSLSLSANQKDEIKDILTPYLVNSNDVFAKEDLNEMLNIFKEIEKDYFKLWFSSINILNTIFNNAVEGRTKYLLDSINKKIKFYVITKKLDEANEILHKQKLLLITGQPGIGKTTLAEVILFSKAKEGFKIYNIENITEAENTISNNLDDKQLFYYDDFLGSNYFEIVNSHKSETQITSFIERIRNTPNKYLILTTRTVILNQAVDRYEKINHSKIASQQFEIKLGDYNKYEKALILYNHLYFRGINDELFDSLIVDKFYQKIIQHSNYTPRIIEFITDVSRIENLTPSSYKSFIIKNLNNPEEIWKYSFNNQIRYLDRCLLLTLFSFENSTSELLLIKAFESRLQYEVQEHNQTITSNQFHQSLQTLLNGFISSRLYIWRETAKREYSFINPSLTDFLIAYVSDSFLERKSIILSIKYFDQLIRFDPNKKIIPFEKELQNILHKKILNEEIEIFTPHDNLDSINDKYIVYLETLTTYCSEINIDDTLLSFLTKINFDNKWKDYLQEFQQFLFNLSNAPNTALYIENNFIKIFDSLVPYISDSSIALNIPDLFKKYNHDYIEYLDELEYAFQNIIDLIENVLDSSKDDLRSNYRDEVKEESDVEEAYSELHNLERELKQYLLPSVYLDYNFNTVIDWYYWQHRISENIKNTKLLSSDRTMVERSYHKQVEVANRNENDDIDDLFSKNI